ncbi:MAG: hypothetical protein S4CHLAM2_13830 [Chlamydiales bacterium]|nr:hypothetical protein [Chlamydiales bacterium]
MAATPPFSLQSTLAHYGQIAMSYCSEVKMTPKLGAHIAIVAALVTSLFMAAIGGNTIFFLAVVGGGLAEAYLLHRIYTKSPWRIGEG